ncbi:MAG: CpsD/CapB family tyrosine-protein kinase [Halanaerobium sp.]|nr:CpsD/CapB family tyrosine-protein kinase [Halanaerobium sp.]
MATRGVRSRDNELITRTHPKSSVSEAYRRIRTNISFLSPDKPLKAIALTSCGAKEGKSLTTVNLAISMAQNGKKVIIIDADLRKPMQHRFFEMTNFNGLSSILTGEIEFAEGLRETGIDNLWLISTGITPPNPAELLASRKMEETLAEAKEFADYILIDTPPAIAVTDAALLGNKVDGVIIVVASHETHEEMLQKSQEVLEKARANIIGTILNKYPVHTESSYYYQYYYYGHDESSSA